MSGFYFLKCSNKTSKPFFHDPRPGKLMTDLTNKANTKWDEGENWVDLGNESWDEGEDWIDINECYIIMKTCCVRRFYQIKPIYQITQRIRFYNSIIV